MRKCGLCGQRIWPLQKAEFNIYNDKPYHAECFIYFLLNNIENVLVDISNNQCISVKPPDGEIAALGACRWSQRTYITHRIWYGDSSDEAKKAAFMYRLEDLSKEFMEREEE